MSASIQSLINSASAQYGVPEPILAWQLSQESSLNPAAYNPASGAAGIAQFIPSTAQQFGIDPYDPSQAIPAAAEYDSQLYQQTGDWTSALTDYGTLANAPAGVMQSWQNVLGQVQSGGSGATVQPASWLGNFFGNLWGQFGPSAPNPIIPGAPNNPLSALPQLFGSQITQLEELGIRVMLGIGGVALIGAGLMLAGLIGRQSVRG